MSGAGAFQPKLSNEAHNVANMMKTSKRYKLIIDTYREKSDCIPILCWKILPSPFNRIGAPLNMSYIHFDLGGNMHAKGFDATRPKPFHLVSRSNPEKIKKLIDD